MSTEAWRPLLDLSDEEAVIWIEKGVQEPVRRLPYLEEERKQVEREFAEYKRLARPFEHAHLAGRGRAGLNNWAEWRGPLGWRPVRSRT